MNKNFKRSLGLVMALAMIVACFAGCGNSNPGTSDAPAGDGAPAEGGSIVIGSIGPLTGTAATYGISVQKGAQLAVDEINAAGGINGMTIEFKMEDDEADGAKAKSAYETLMDKGMQVLIGTVTSGAGVSINDLVKEDGILQVTPSASQLECAQNPNTFRICFTDPLQGTAMAEYAFNTLSYKKVAIIYNQDDSYSSGIYNAFKEKWAELGGEIVADTSFPNDASDFSSQLTTIQGASADFLFMPIYAEKAAQIAVEASKKGITLPLIGCDGIDGILNYLEGDNAALVEGMIYLTPFVASDANPAIQAFTAAYKAAYNVEPDQFSADAYDAVYVVKAAMEKAGTTVQVDNAALVSAMVGLTYDGLTGSMTFNEAGEPNKPAKVAKIVNGAYVAQ